MLPAVFGFVNQKTRDGTYLGRIMREIFQGTPPGVGGVSGRSEFNKVTDQ